MTSGYPYESISINRREVTIRNIVGGTAPANSDFEKHTFTFIQSWFAGQEEFLLHTSGSTGAPKPVRLMRSQLTASAELTRKALDLRPGDHALVCLDTRYIAGQMMLVRCFVTGMKIVAVEPQANPLSAVDKNSSIDFAAFVPYHVYHILASGDTYRMSSIRNVIIGGAPLSGDATGTLSGFPSHVYLTYGMTETISHMALQRLDNTNDGVFKALPGISLSVDGRGCLVIEAPYLDGKQITNDLVDLVGPESFRWLGRVDNVLNSGGVKISPEAIERVIESVFDRLNLHHRFVVSACSDAALGDKIVLVLESELVDEVLNETLFKQMESLLQAYSRPKKILVLPSFPETNTGKIDRLGIKKFINERPRN